MQHPKSHNLAQSFGYALTGISRTLMTQRNMRIHVLAAIGVLILGLIFPFEALSKAIILLCITLVLFAEILNTAMEAIVDLYTGETHRLAQIAKDAAAGGVMLLSFASFFIFLGLLELHQDAILKTPLLLEKVGFALGLVALEAICLFVRRSSAITLLCQTFAVVGMIFLATLAGELIFSAAALLLMALVSFAPLVYARDEAH